MKIFSHKLMIEQITKNTFLKQPLLKVYNNLQNYFQSACFTFPNLFSISSEMKKIGERQRRKGNEASLNIHKPLESTCTFYITRYT